MKNYILLKQELEKISHIDNVISVLYWDISVNIPVGAINSRTKEIAYLSSLTHSILTSSKLGELVDSCTQDAELLDEWQLANVQAIKKSIIESKCIDEDLRTKYIMASTKCEMIWREARQNNDYQLLKPYLQSVLDYTKEMAQAKAPTLNCSAYEALVDKYDPGRKSEDIRKVFNEIKTTLPTLIDQVIAKQSNDKVLPMTKPISKDLQKLIAKGLMEIMEFNFTTGRLDESAHPFCGGTPYDIRLTNRYNEYNIISGIMGVIHETGHGLYEYNLPTPYKNQPVGNAKGMAIHESQSLFMEMQVGRSREFCEFLATLLRDEFNLQGAEYSADNLYKLVTRVSRSYIRVEADEVTYPLHVIIRFELEEALIKGELSLDDLPYYWNNKMHEYVGVRPKNDREGCLQDIHWPMGSFGYFPSYTNGAIIASMLMHQAQIKNSNIKAEIIGGDFSNINHFLNNNIRKYGSLKTTSKLLEDATGKAEVQPQIFLTYLKQKYLTD
ncbi:carboxypeptidase M32 [Candidatus Tisiphia endosymbiont of Nemotelus uliginosus]|uniref:carboxypeptidase M32 n=1 Tax=Candidatus Tisiphia endosymbiont of Nemotelus uliginosus TaxID=3077926 RepID=UPI0035C8FDC3